jgi:hypothetical protein
MDLLNALPDDSISIMPGLLRLKIWRSGADACQQIMIGVDQELKDVRQVILDRSRYNSPDPLVETFSLFTRLDNKTSFIDTEQEYAAFKKTSPPLHLYVDEKRVSPPPTWTCGACTYNNQLARSSCEMCGNTRPPPPPQPRPPKTPEKIPVIKTVDKHLGEIKAVLTASLLDPSAPLYGTEMEALLHAGFSNRTCNRTLLLMHEGDGKACLRDLGQFFREEPPPTFWACAACTYENDLDRSSCEICEGKQAVKDIREIKTALTSSFLDPSAPLYEREMETLIKAGFSNKTFNRALLLLHGGDEDECLKHLRQFFQRT